MCELPHGLIEYSSRMSREMAEQKLLSLGAVLFLVTDDRTFFRYEILLTPHQRNYSTKSKHRDYLEGGVLIDLHGSDIRVDGDVRLYDPICDRFVGPQFCPDEQSRGQKVRLTRLANKIRTSIEETVSTV